MIKIRSLPKLPKIELKSPDIVLILDKIRRDLNNNYEYSEFDLFAREYSRYFRYHIEHAEYRLISIYKRYENAMKYFKNESPKYNDGWIESSYRKPEVRTIYWDFEAYLNALNSSLEILARIIGTAYKRPAPITFNRLCAKSELKGLVDILRAAKKRWIRRLKEYRNLFTHFSPTDYSTLIFLRRYGNEAEIYALLPSNPIIRESIAFTYNRRTELLKYSITVYRHILALDKKIAKEIWGLYKLNQYPKRFTNLFFAAT